MFEIYNEWILYIEWILYEWILMVLQHCCSDDLIMIEMVQNIIDYIRKNTITMKWTFKVLIMRNEDNL